MLTENYQVVLYYPAAPRAAHKTHVARSLSVKVKQGFLQSEWSVARVTQAFDHHAGALYHHEKMALLLSAHFR